MSQNRNVGRDPQQNTGRENISRGLGSREEDQQRRNDRKETEKTGNKTTGTTASKERENMNLERDSSRGTRESVDTNTRRDQEEGSPAGRSGSKGQEEQRRENKPA